MTTTAQQIAERLDKVWMDAHRHSEHYIYTDSREFRVKFMLNFGLREAVEALEIYVDLFGDDHAGDPARCALTALKGEKA